VAWSGKGRRRALVDLHCRSRAAGRLGVGSALPQACSRRRHSVGAVGPSLVRRWRDRLLLCFPSGRGSLTSTAQSELAAVEASLRHASVTEHPDARVLPGGMAFSCTFSTAAAAYRFMHYCSGEVLPLAEQNWRNFAPIKVKVFFRVARTGTRGRARCFAAMAASLPPGARSSALFFRCPRPGPFFAPIGV
jgi:hypothetical protein